MESGMPVGNTGAVNTGTRYNSIIVAGVVPVALAVYYVMGHLDTAVALYVQQHLYANRIWHRYTSLIPDALLLVVILITVVSFLLYRLRLSSGKLDRLALMYKMLACAAPVSFCSKSLFKYVFGRITTREWLRTPGEAGFHWFQGTESHVGFPSGHMLVITALAAVVCRLHPGWRSVSLPVLLLLAVALVATNYHFVSDVLAGAYLGLLVEVCLFRVVLQPGMCDGRESAE